MVYQFFILLSQLVNQLKAQTMNNLSKTITRETYLTPPQIETIEVVVEAGFTYSGQGTTLPSFGGENDEEDWDNS